MTITITEQVDHTPTMATPRAWSPEPNYVELHVATLWARRHADEFDVVVLTSLDEDGEQPALASGTISQTLLLLAGYWVTRPAELHRLVDAGLLDLVEISPEHPVLAYAEDHLPPPDTEIDVASWAALGLTPADVETADAVAHTAAAAPTASGDLDDLPF